MGVRPLPSKNTGDAAGPAMPSPIVTLLRLPQAPNRRTLNVWRWVGSRGRPGPTLREKPQSRPWRLSLDRFFFHKDHIKLPGPCGQAEFGPGASALWKVQESSMRVCSRDAGLSNGRRGVFCLYPSMLRSYLPKDGSSLFSVEWLGSVRA